MGSIDLALMCAASFAGAFVLSVAILNRCINEGVVIKFGLILMSLSLYATGALTLNGVTSMVGIWRATVMLHIGLLIVIAGYAWRVQFRKDRRMFDTNWRLHG